MTVSYTRLEGMILTYYAGAEVYPYRLVKFGTAADSIVQAAAATDLVIGVSKVPQGKRFLVGTTVPAGTLPAPVGMPVDVVMSQIAEVEYGGAVTLGAALTSDANGKAIVATTGNNILGYAMVAGANGTIGNILIARGKA